MEKKAFANPTKGYHFSPAEKERIILEHIKDGVTLQELSLRYDVNRSTIISWLRKVRSGGSLYDVKRRGRPPKTQWQDQRKDPQTGREASSREPPSESGERAAKK